MIYFISAGNKIKIGYTNNVVRRINELQTSNAKSLKLVGLMDGDYKTEAALHRKFKHLKERGEWFKFKGALQDSIIAFTSEKINFKINNIKDLEQAGLIIHCLRKAKRLRKNGNSKLHSQINKYRDV